MPLGRKSFQSNGLLSYLASVIPEGALVISVGLPGTGKSYLLERLRRARNIPVLRSDLIRRELLEGLDVFDEAVASDEKKKVTVYEEMFRRAEKAMQANPGTALDATFFKAGLRLEAAKIAAKLGRPFVVIECVCSREKALERIRGRANKAYESNAITQSAYDNVKALFEPVQIECIKAHFPSLSLIYLRINTEEDGTWTIEEERRL